MTLAPCRAAPWVVVIDGQSLNGAPGPLTAYPYQMLHPRGVPFVDCWISGLAWVQLDNANMISARNLYDHADSALQSVLFMCGGTTDIEVGVTGANLYTVVSDYAIAAKDPEIGGYDYVVCTTVPPSTGFDATEDTERQAFNEALVADALGSFDGVVDLTTDSRLESDPSDTTYYSDGTHWTYAASTIVAALGGAALDTIPGFPAAA